MNTITRGRFVRLPTWQGLCSRPDSQVHLDELGAYVKVNRRVCYRQYKYLTGLAGLVIEVSEDGEDALVRIQNGETNEIPVWLLDPITWRY